MACYHSARVFRRSVRFVCSTPLFPCPFSLSRFSLSPDCSFLILACDGVWDVFTDDDAVTYVAQAMEKMVRLQNSFYRFISAACFPVFGIVFSLPSKGGRLGAW